MKRIIIFTATFILSASMFWVFSGITAKRESGFRHDELVQYVSAELEYEIMYGNADVNPSDYVDTVLQQKLKRMKK